MDNERKIFASKISAYYSVCFVRDFNFISLSFSLFCSIIYIASLCFYTLLCLKLDFFSVIFLHPYMLVVSSHISAESH